MTEEEKSLWERARDTVGDAVDKVEDLAEDAVETVGDIGEAIGDKASDLWSSDDENDSKKA